MQGWKYQKIGEDLGWLSRNGFTGELQTDLESPAIEEEREFLRLLDLLRLYCYTPAVKNVNLLNKIHRLNIGNRLKNLVKQICTGRGRYTVSMFPDAIQAYSRERRAVLSRMPDSETKLADHEDMMEAIWALYEAYIPKTLKGWEEIVDSIFKESGHAPICFYTIHSGKGGEGQVTFFLYPEETPIRWRGQSDDELAQEHHMIYVANSRTLADGVPGSGVHYLVLRGSEKAQYPSWLPREYCLLWKETTVVTEVA